MKHISKIHLAQLDNEQTYCGKSTQSSVNGRVIGKDILTTDLEKVTCKTCKTLYDKSLGITPYLLFPDQDLFVWSKTTCEPNCGSILDNGMETTYPDSTDDFIPPKSGCTVTATANPLVKIYRRGMDDMLVVPLFV